MSLVILPSFNNIFFSFSLFLIGGAVNFLQGDGKLTLFEVVFLDTVSKGTLLDCWHPTIEKKIVIDKRILGTCWFKVIPNI